MNLKGEVSLLEAPDKEALFSNLRTLRAEWTITNFGIQGLG